MKMSDSTLATVVAARSPPGSCQTATASSTRIAMLRRCVRRSGPTTPRIPRRRYAWTGSDAGTAASATGARVSTGTVPSAGSASNR